MAIFRRNKDRGPRTVLITGAASGLGLELAKNFLALGDRVVLTDLHESMPSSVSALPGDREYRKLDVTSDDDWQAAVDAVGGLDIRVSNAGIAIGGRITEISMETWYKGLEINLLGSVRGVRHCVPIIRRGGQVVLTGSVAGLVHPPVMSTYNATKAAVVALGETLDAELRPQGISTSVICPQFFRSGLAASLQGDDPAADDVARLLLAKSWLNSETVAKRAMKGIAARRVVITPDGAALFSWLAKRFTRLGYLVVLRGVGYGVAWRVRRRAQ